MSAVPEWTIGAGKRVQWRCWRCDEQGITYSVTMGHLLLKVHLSKQHRWSDGMMGDVRVVLPG